ncbi:hypothetical protein CAPTEDRAFT_214946, partial [Capitella teleta]
MANNAENNEIVRSLIASLNEVDSYKEKVEGSCDVVCEEEQITVLQPGEPCSREISMIYTFNYQELPSIPKRQDSIFIPMPPKHGIFFVRCEGNAGQVNFLIDEAYQTTNGSNAVISCLHRFFENYGLGETRVDLYCNNGSNNKNNCLLWYLAYNVAKKLHVSIELHFLPKEHSKPILDEYFADIKQATKKTKGSIADLNSSIGESEDSNQSHIIDGRNDQMLDWQEHFRHDCRELPKIRSMQHFRFNFENPGVVFYSENVDNGEGEFRLFNQDSPVLTKKVPAIPLPDKHIDRKLWRYEGEFTVLEKLGEEDQDVYSVEHNLDRGRYALKKVSLTKNAVPDEEMDSYKEKVEGSKVVCEEKQITVLQPSEPRSRVISMIYTFNYQKLPSIPKRQDSIFLPMQPKHGIFFVRCEGNAGQVNFLIDEAYQTTNGSNAVISCLHRFFESYGLGETHVDLYCNNGPNNKNNCLLWYLAYNVAKKLHVSIELYFLPKEHSKPILDEYFADIKQAVTKTKGSIADLNSLIGESEDSNQSHIIDGKNDQMLNWQEHFRLHCKKLNGIQSMHHFRFNSENPGVVFYSKNVDNGEGEFRLFDEKSAVLTTDVPAIPLPDKHIDRKLWRYKGEFTVLGKLGEKDKYVYSVEHNLDGRRYALKKVSLTKNAVPDEVLKEAKNLAKLEHVNVVRYHTAWLEDEAESELPDA